MNTEQRQVVPAPVVPSLPVMVQEINIGQLIAVRGMENEWVVCQVIAYTRANSIGERVFIETKIEQAARALPAPH